MMQSLRSLLLIIPKTSCVKLPEMLWGGWGWKKKQHVYLQSQVLLGWGSSALMQEDVALTEAACPLSKSNYDNHASGKAVARRTARQALMQQAAYLNHSSPPLQTPALANVDGLLKRSVRLLCRLLLPPLSWYAVVSLLKASFVSPALPSHQRWMKVLLFLGRTGEWCFLSKPFRRCATVAEPVEVHSSTVTAPS